MHPLGANITHWTSESTRRWFLECDALNHVGRRRAIVRDYFEGYVLRLTERHYFEKDEDEAVTWIYICSSCLVEELSHRLAIAEEKSKMKRATIICTPGYANWLRKFSEPRHPRLPQAWAFKEERLTPIAVKVTFDFRGALPPYRGE